MSISFVELFDKADSLTEGQVITETTEGIRLTQAQAGGKPISPFYTQFPESGPEVRQRNREAVQEADEETILDSPFWATWDVSNET